MPAWTGRVDVKVVLDRYTGTNFRGVAEQVRRKLEASGLFQGAEVLEELKYAEEDSDATAFNVALDSLYDYADLHGIWLGPIPDK